jgi:hypothetical protein
MLRQYVSVQTVRILFAQAMMFGRHEALGSDHDAAMVVPDEIADRIADRLNMYWTHI